MSRSTKAPALIATAAAVLSLSAALATSAQAASKPSAKKTPATKTVTACVNKKTGATRVLLGSKAKKKCARGWTKVTWSVAGKDGKNGTGTNGTNGTNGTDGKNAGLLQVRDGAGNAIGTYAGLYPAPFPVYQVLRGDGGLYTYLPDGQLLPSLGFGPSSPLFLDPGCTGTAYASFGTTSPTIVSWLVGPGRVVFRAGADVASLGAPRVWQYTSTTVTVTAPVPAYYQLDGVSGLCVAAAPAPVAGNTLVTLSSIPVPPQPVGPLSIG